MSTILILVFFLTVIALFSLLKPDEFRENILKAFLITFFVIGLCTEILSLFNSITFRWIQTTWFLAVFTSLLILVIIWIRKKTSSSEQSQTNNVSPRSLSKGSVFFYSLIIILITSITLYIALKSPPNNFDSMTYHMARIPHWIQNQNIRYYPTAIPRQNYSMPLAEFGILHLQILSKSDRYANLIQWFSFVLSIMSTTLIAKQLKVSVRGQWITAILMTTLPMAILQSTSTQNDLVVSVFCIGFAYFLNKYIKEKGVENVLFAGISMGMALATKGTAYIFCAALGLGIGGFSLIGQKWNRIKELSTQFMLMIVIALILNTGIYLRNWNLYQNPLITSNERTMVETISPGILFSNIIRNGAIHLATPLSKGNDFIEGALTNLLGQQINNPASTFQGSEFELSFNLNEDDAGNLLHFLLLTICLLILPFLKFDNKKEKISYLLSVFLSIILFSMVFKWQPWGGRLQTPIFLLGCVGIGSVLDRLFKKDFFPTALLLILLITSAPYLILNSKRPLLPLWKDDSVFYDTPLKKQILSGINQKMEGYPGLSKSLNSIFSIFYDGQSVVVTERRELYFMSNFDPYWYYLEALHYVRNDPAVNIGLLMDSNDWEYPVWVLVGQHASPGPRVLYHILVEDISNNISSNLNPQPELILSTRSNIETLSFLTDYEIVYDSPSIQILKLID